jgi:cytochrome c oxidase subunit 2
MHIHTLERNWLWVAGSVVALLLGTIVYTAIAHNIHPPGQMETIDSASLHLGGEFAEDQLGVRVGADGQIRVTLVAARYGFFPRNIELPSGTPITFRIASADVLHGIHAPMTNLGTMIVPGYVSTVTTLFPKPGEYPLLCNEYCGLGHDHMWSKLTVVDPQNWHPDR